MKKNFMLLITFTLLALLGTAGCSVDANISTLLNSNQPSQPTGMTKSPPELRNFISSSGTNIQTTGGYKVKTVIGNPSDKIYAQTTGGYKIYLSVHADLLSDK